ncbi:hypothetical protein [Amycolatopsis sp. NPDC059021]|uniref:hypothetical protein n=1 Tax=Amycolatopsis sp. NPDC059021 TaxID=3346704 RepID=UPI00366C5777
MGTGGRQRHVNQALMRIPRRAESTDRATLTQTFVTAGSFSAMLHSTDHQIIYGRRGTGKTHALLYLSDLVDNTGDIAVYLDLRTLGSAGGLYADGSLSTAARGTHLLIDTLEAIHEELLAVAVDRELGDPEVLLPALDALAEAATAVEVVGEVERETRAGLAEEATNGVEAGVPLSLKMSMGHRRSVSGESRLRRTGTERSHLVFGPLNRAMRTIAGALEGRRIWLLLDEWSSLPLELQPLLADLLRRCVLPTAGMTVKIAAIERRSRFRERLADGDHLGIEVGADAASAVSLDDIMIFDASRTRAQEFFAQLFHNHAGSRLASMISSFLPPDPASFVADAFRGTAFAELVRAAEGVPRDAINIAALAAQYAHDGTIGLRDVRLAARDWYLRDKQTAISGNGEALRLLRLLVDEVVGKRRSRTFVLDQLSGARHEMIEDLYDARLLHVLRRGLVDSHRPGTLYDGYAIDYGCYVALLLGKEARRTRPHARGAWLTSAKGVPPDGFSLVKEAVDLDALGRLDS